MLISSGDCNIMKMLLINGSCIENVMRENLLKFLLGFLGKMWIFEKHNLELAAQFK